MESNGETIKTEHIYFWGLILWGLLNKPIHKQIVHFCPNINLTALKDIGQSPTPSHFHTLLPCSIIRNISLHSLHQSQGQGKVPPKTKWKKNVHSYTLSITILLVQQC